MNVNASQTVAQGWARARKLAELGDSTPAKARTFLKHHKEYAELLDGDCDKRNPTVRAMLDEFAKPIKTRKTRKTKAKTRTNSKTRTSKGDKTRPPRAGAPNIYRTNSSPDLSLLKGLREAKARHEAIGERIQACIDAMES